MYRKHYLQGGFPMLKSEPKQLSLYSILYNRIPQNHILKLINDAVDFKFINKLLEESYCKYYGRPAKEPVITSYSIHYTKLYDAYPSES